MKNGLRREILRVAERLRDAKRVRQDEIEVLATEAYLRLKALFDPEQDGELIRLVRHTLYGELALRGIVIERTPSEVSSRLDGPVRR